MHYEDYILDTFRSIYEVNSEESATQLQKEQVFDSNYLVGDVMYDAFKIFGEIAENNYPLKPILPFNREEYYLAIIHSPYNTDNPENLSEIISSFSELDKPVLWPVHPRNKSRLSKINLSDNLILLKPVSYFRLNTLLRVSYKILTDSGGLQKEAYWAKKPVYLSMNNHNGLRLNMDTGIN